MQCNCVSPWKPISSWVLWCRQHQGLAPTVSSVSSGAARIFVKFDRGIARMGVRCLSGSCSPPLPRHVRARCLFGRCSSPLPRNVSSRLPSFSRAFARRGAGTLHNICASCVTRFVCMIGESAGVLTGWSFVFRQWAFIAGLPSSGLPSSGGVLATHGVHDDALLLSSRSHVCGLRVDHWSLLLSIRPQL